MWPIVLLSFCSGLSSGIGIYYFFQIKFDYIIIAILLASFIGKITFEYIRSSDRFGQMKSILSIFILPLLLNKLKGFLTPKKETTIVVKDSLLNISYHYKEREYHLVIPIGTETLKTIRYEVFLNKNNERMNITQQPGIDYKYSAADYGGESIKIVNKLTGEEKIISPNEIPFC